MILSSARTLIMYITHLSVQRRAWVLFYPQNVEVKSSLQLRVSYVSFLEPETTWTDKTFVLRGLACEAVTYEGDLRGPKISNGRVRALWV